MKHAVRVLLVLVFAATFANAQTTIYWKKDYIRDASGATIAVATPAPSDTTAPEVPSSLQATSTTTSSVTLAWSGSSDLGGSALAGYVIYRGAVPVGAVSGTGFTDAGLSSNTAYSYRVVAFDNAFNYSGYSNTVAVTTDANSGAPLSLVAAAPSTSQINLAWSPPQSGSPDHYGIWRRSNSAWTKIDTTTSGIYADVGVNANTAYVYKVSAEDSSNQVQGWTNVDIATTVFFSDDPLAAGSTVIKAAHVNELRTAVNAVRAAAGLSTATWTNTSLSGAWIKAVDIYELRTNLGDAINVLGLAAPNYTDSTLITYPPNSAPLGVAVKKAHIEEIRQRVK